ncbi:S-adenosyl-L-methionine-dependent methyltransferase [Gigaspora rosea]|uniref:S-adenosyl-L-methionine-dependent methyltransferase n=1 Tax=Gigaspora rosea TaxID=44941 RepID=A0A397VJZ4_9GLOM|nr:S-adenosyl-L-methionine-dependent methyltransferase [Gigaspora rosea]
MDSQSTQSIQPEFRYIDGRRFHNVENAMYHLPNDENETDRLHLQHFLIRYLWQSNFSAPVDHNLSKPGAKVLDVGCGAASWSFDIATTYPLAKVIGLDISPYQPTTIKPKNFEFVKGNVQERLPFDDNTFDFVFQRFLVFGITKEKWTHVVNELVRVLKPDGFLELCEPSSVFDVGPATKRIWDCETKMLEERGCDFESYQKIEEYARNQGQLENIKKESKRCYYGTVYNSVEFSKAALSNMSYAYVSLKPILSKKLQVSDEEYDELTKISEKESAEHNSYFQIVRVYASKITIFEK